jgi:dTDP-4-amino-4,6-dideoxygalactose transaminase
MLSSANPRAGYLAHKEEIDSAIRNVMENGRYIMGPQVAEFEEHFAGYLGVAHCIGVASGTDALQLSLRACGVKAGDGVITASHTAVATVAAVDWIGAIPVLVDVDSSTQTLDPQKVEDTLRWAGSIHIKAIIAVHLYGNPADMNALRTIAERYGVILIEDCAQAHGAALDDDKVGSIGECGAFSFYPTKNLGAFGDGGAVVARGDHIANGVRSLQQYGWRERYISEREGYNSRLDELQAAVLNAKLQWLDDGNNRRRGIAAQYAGGLSGLPLDLPRERPGVRHVYHQYVIQSAERDPLQCFLANQGIQTAILYPMAVHQQPAYRDRAVIGQGGMDVTEQVVRRILSLPMYPELDDANVEKVIKTVRGYFGK